MFGAVVVSQPFDTQLVEHLSSLFWVPFLGVKRDDAPSDQVLLLEHLWMEGLFRRSFLASGVR